MNQNFNKPDFRKYFFYALIIKGVLLLLFAFLFNKGEGKQKTLNYIFTFSRDYKSYIEPTVNLIENGSYYEEAYEKKLYAHKMPGMMPIYGPLYYIFGFSGGLTALVIIQYLVDALCCVLIGRVALKLFNNTKAFYLTFVLYSFSTIISIGTHYAVSEFFCTSFSVIALYFITNSKRNRDYFFAGLFATWAVFFRPTSILVFLLFPIILVLNSERRISLKSILQNKTRILLFFLAFIITETFWIGRNYKVLDRFIPADISLENFGTPGMNSVFRMLLGLGLDLQSWNPDGEMRWFNNPGTMNYDENYATSNPFPSYVFEGSVKIDDLKSIREKYHLYNQPEISKEQKLLLENEIEVLCNRTLVSFKQNAPFSYYVIAPLRTLKTLIFIKRPYGFSFPNNGLLEKAVRTWHFISYYFSFLLFFISFLWIFKLKDKRVLFIALYVISHVLLYGFILRYSENRYIVPIHPYVVIIATGSILFLLTKMNNINKLFSFFTPQRV